ncbi:hypothetical protein E5Q_04230 [Mixia osmundae IAM 14324]|uniref:PABS domain-containing protein n=2 Tax=Mixia osmundae (strain CBS 9802 / IAM 14324 / JCM 22182 / KY 12970) TaxID=764103 RepID=G7E3Z2_MIXOS|nr:hypothetical protein E5Q_04230 [Mixia osmundae IAM 14324]
MRCDHSLLGGVWINTDGPSGPESVYATFILQEAIRFVERSAKHDESPRALLIGLGAGISARALHVHGLNTTIVEIDPAIYRYAQEYFGLPSPRGGAHIQDARQYLTQHAARQAEPYDYIIHDVFTGGSVPSSLFTAEHWREIKGALRKDGILAVNFVGHLTSPGTRAVLHTILASFQHCKAFADGSASSADDVQNMVIFCSPSRPITLRPLHDSDSLSSPLRHRVFESMQDNDIDLRSISEYAPVLLTDKDTSALDVEQSLSSVEHWHVMRRVLPARAWERY